MKRSLTVSMYGPRSYSQPCEANSAVQITSERKTSQSPAFASWRWTNWLRCSSAEAGNSTIFTESPCDLCFALNCFDQDFVSPVVSLPVQYTTCPLADFIESTSIFLASLIAEPPPPPPPPPALSEPSSPPQPATASTAAAPNAARTRLLITLSPCLHTAPLPYPGGARRYHPGAP